LFSGESRFESLTHRHIASHANSEGDNINIFIVVKPVAHDEIQESPAIADKPARRESMPKIASIRRAYNVVADNTGLSSFV